MSTPITKPEHAVALKPLEFAGNAAGYLTTEEAYPYMCLKNREAVAKRCGTEITARKIGKEWMIHKDDIDTWIKRHTHKAINPTGRRWAA